MPLGQRVLEGNPSESGGGSVTKSNAQSRSIGSRLPLLCARPRSLAPDSFPSVSTSSDTDLVFLKMEPEVSEFSKYQVELETRQPDRFCGPALG